MSVGVSLPKFKLEDPSDEDQPKKSDVIKMKYS